MQFRVYSLIKLKLKLSLIIYQESSRHYAIAIYYFRYVKRRNY